MNAIEASNIAKKVQEEKSNAMLLTVKKNVNEALKMVREAAKEGCFEVTVTLSSSDKFFVSNFDKELANLGYSLINLGLNHKGVQLVCISWK